MTMASPSDDGSSRHVRAEDKYLILYYCRATDPSGAPHTASRPAAERIVFVHCVQPVLLTIEAQQDEFLTANAKLNILVQLVIN